MGPHNVPGENCQEEKPMLPIQFKGVTLLYISPFVMLVVEASACPRFGSISSNICMIVDVISACGRRKYNPHGFLQRVTSNQ